MTVNIMATISARERLHISVHGVVQGVGFRPFIYQLAERYHLKGWVCNTSEGVKIEVEGDGEALRCFLGALREEAPPRSSIEEVTVSRSAPAHYEQFEIRQSVTEAGKYQLVSPDITTCPDCLAELFDPADRRYRYAFTNCTNCGPRFTIIEDIPYDRPLTTMSHFRMCPECQREYDNPLDRRFHAQPNACAVCGPTLSLLDAQGQPVENTDVISATSRLLREGKIVAVKGLGGFLLACDATSATAVRQLRDRKHRPCKPFAIMVTSLDEAGKYCYVNIEEEKLLISPPAPIVLLERRPVTDLAEAVAPGLKHLGVMLPCTPPHHLLLRETGLPLIMTSGNLSEEPIARDNDEALRRLSGIADYFMMHNRDIYARYDDSVTMVERGTPQLVRRARGYAPYPVKLGFTGEQVLACGSELKNTFCLTRDRHAFVSQHIGDMENMETLEHFEDTIALYRKLFRIEPKVIAHDMHPDYLATRYARELAARSPGLRLVPVHHHHAHIVSGMVDNGVEGPVIGVAFDGTGYGTDGNIWGGEFMVADYSGFTRKGHIEYLPLPGGDKAIKKPYRTATGYLLTLLGPEALDSALPFLKGVDTSEVDIIRHQVTHHLNAPLTSSCGRLFDAIAALAGVRNEADYEAQAAIELEALACDAPGETGVYPFSIEEKDGVSIIRLRELFAAVLGDVRAGVSMECIAARFHNTVPGMIVEMCQALAAATSLRRVVLSGGVFQNRLLSRKTVGLLESAGFTVFTHRQVPCNDGGISLGQAVIANFCTHRE